LRGGRAKNSSDYVNLFLPESAIWRAEIKRIKPARAGFTLVEALVVLLILAALLLIAIPAFYSLLQNYYLKTAATQMGIQLRLARNACITQKVLYRATFRSSTSFSSPNTYIIEYQKAPFTFSVVQNLDFHLPSGIEIVDSPVFSSGVATINFNTRGGATSTTGTPPYDVNIRSSVNGSVYRIRVYLTGDVDVTKT
jgi:prepilin-type N-terminal cleavage/methylation domain-containing protein